MKHALRPSYTGKTPPSCLSSYGALSSAASIAAQILRRSDLGGRVGGALATRGGRVDRMLTCVYLQVS